MKLITKQIERRLEKYPLYCQDGKGDDAKVILKFFLAAGSWTWYVLEAQKNEDGYLFFGIVINGYGEAEYGYFTLSELKGIKVRFGRLGYLTIERDKYFTPATVKELKLDQML